MTLLYFGVSTEGAFLFLLMVLKASAFLCLVNPERQNNFFLLRSAKDFLCGLESDGLINSKKTVIAVSVAAVLMVVVRN